MPLQPTVALATWNLHLGGSGRLCWLAAGRHVRLHFPHKRWSVGHRGPLQPTVALATWNLHLGGSGRLCWLATGENVE